MNEVTQATISAVTEIASNSAINSQGISNIGDISWLQIVITSGIVSSVVAAITSLIVQRNQARHERLMESYKLYVIEKQKIYNKFWKKLLTIKGKMQGINPEDAPEYYAMFYQARSEFFANQLYFSNHIYKNCDELLWKLVELKEIQTSSSELKGKTDPESKKLLTNNGKKFRETNKSVSELITKIGQEMRAELSAGYDYYGMNQGSILTQLFSWIRRKVTKDL